MATTPRKDLPGTNAPNWSQRVTEELRVLMGRGGNGRALTAKDLIDSGIAKPGAGGGLVPGVPGGGDTEPDLTPPPTPTGFVAHGAISNLVMEHDSPIYPQGHGHGMTVVYGVIQSPSGPLPTFDKAVELMRFAGAVASYASNPGTTWRLWIKWLSADGVLSVAPAGGINGLEVSTGQDVSQLLDVLNGKITQSQLYATLSREIELISGTGSGSVNARVLAEAQARAQALVAESSARAQAIAAEAATRAQAVASEAAARGQDVAAMAADLQAATNDLQARIDAVNAQVSDIIGASDFDLALAYEEGQLVKYQNKLYRAKVNTVGNLPTNTTYWDLVGDYASLGEAVAAHAAQLADHANRITQTEQGLTAEASARTTLAAQLRGNYTGSDVTQVTSGLVWSERQARVSGDSANASAIDAVKARMPAGTGKVASEASVIDEAAARAAADAAAASRTTVIEARLPAGTGALATAAAVTALDTRVTAAEGSLTSQSGQITSLSNTLTTTTGTANAAQAAAQAASDLAGGKGKVIYSTTAPAVADRQAQNLWIDTTGGANTPKRWTGSAWTAVTDKVATDAAAAAAAAQATANTKADASALTALDSKVTSQGNTLAAQGSSITSLKAGLADGSSVNKLANTAFSPEGKQPTTDANGAIAIIARNQLPADVVAGCPASSCAILNLNAGTGSVLRFPFTDSIHATNANRAVGWAPSGGAVDVGCWVFSPASNISAVRLACWYFKEDSSSAGSAAIAGTTYNKTVGGWQYLSGRANVPADAASMAFTVQVLTGAAGDKIYATEPYVAFPNAASMRADGTAEALTSLTARVTAAEGVNTSQSTSITNLQNSVTSLQSGKADASALSALDSKVTTQGNTLNSQGSAITALQNSITNGPVLPSDFSGGLVNWTGSRQGDPTAVNTVSGTIVTDDADFGVCAQFNNWTSLGIGMLTKGLVQAIPGRVYRVRARFKVVAAPSFPLGMNIVAGGNTAIFASGGDAFSNPVTITAAGQIGEITALFSDKAANAVGAVTWGATAVLLRFGLRLNTALASGLQLRVQSITIEDATADAANADATTALTARVTTAEGNITSTSGALTTLTNRVTAAEGVNASQATAISGLQTSVTTINGTLTSQGSSITSLSNSLDALQGAGDNLLKASNVELVRAAESYQMGGYTTTETLIQGETYTLVACITHTPASGDVTSSVGAWVNGLKTINQNLVRNGSKVIATATFVFDNSAAAGTLVNFYYYPSTVKTGAATVHWACLYQGKVVPPKAWQPSMAEMGATLQGKADSSALTALASRVTTAEGNISSTSSALTTLTNRVTAAEGVNTSQATAITGLNSSVTTINGTLTSQASQITNLQAGLAEAGGQNLLYNPSFDVVGTLGFADGYQAGGRSAGVTITPSLVPSWIDPVGLAQRIDATGLGTSLYSDLVCITGNSTKPKPTAMEGQRVALSAYVRASAGISVRMYIQARSDQNSNTTIATSTGALETPGENGARITLVTSALPAGTTALHILFRVFGTGTVSSGWVEWDRAQVELGTTVTAWRDNGVAGLSAVNAAVNTLATASANADAALASRATLLESRMPTGTGQLATAAALTAVDTRVTNIDGRVTSESTRLDQVQAAVGSAAACLQALNPLGGESEWSAVGGATAATFVTVAEPDARGGAVLTVGNGTTSGERWLRHVATIPMDENKLYKLSARFRRTAGDGGIYLGIAGLNAAKSLYVNTSNVETSSISAAHYAINNAKPALGTLQVVEYYFKGRAAGAATGSGTKAAPRAFANKVAHLALMIVGNYQGQVGFFDLDYITLEDVTAAEQASAAIATEATTRATTDGYLGAQYSVRMQLSQGGQQVVGGFGISGTTSGTAGPQIDFGVMANSFWIAAPSGSPGGVSNVKPFVVQTTAQTVNGVSVPAGVYMDAAYINNVTALWARFGNLVADTIQATSISVTKLTAGNLAVGSYINSSNYVNGSAGWSINSNGWAEFSQVTVRGAIYSSAGTIGGITINGNGLNSGGFSGYQWPPAGQSGFHISPNGILLGNANNGRYIEIQSNGNLYAPGFYIENGNATFWGNISGATGTFSGTLIAQNVVTTGNLQYNSATGIVNSTMMSLLHWPWNSWPGDIITLTVPAADGASITSIHYAYEQIIANQDADILFKIDGVAVFTKTVLGNSSAYNNYISGQMETMEIINVPFTFSGNGSARTLAIEVRPRGGNGYIFFYARFRSITANTSKR